MNDILKLLQDADALFIKNLFSSELRREVKVLLFTSEKGCQYCGQTEQLVREIVSQSDKAKVDVLDIGFHESVAREMEISLTPATVILSSNGSRLYYYGMPSGFQLRCLIDDIVDASEATTSLSATAREIIGRIENPVDIKVFVTPTCPYSPKVVKTAHRFAIENQRIRAQMIESLEFSELTRKHNVVGVPTTILNDRFRFEGVLSDEVFAERVAEVAGASVADGVQ